MFYVVLTDKVLIILHQKTHHHFACVLTRACSKTYIHENEKNLGKDALQKYSSHSFFFVYVVYVVGFSWWSSSSNDDFEDDDVSGKISSKR